MKSLRQSSPVALTPVLALLFALLLPILGCGADAYQDPNESPATRAIREKVQAEMERERLQRIGRRLAAFNERLASSPDAYGVPISADAGAESESTEAADVVDLAVGEELYTVNCGSCHGPRGNGDGPAAAGLVPQPVKHSDGGYMNALSNEHLFKVIQQGGPAVGKSAMMAPWGTSLSDNQILSVITFIRTLAEPPYEGPAPEEA